MGLDGRKEQYRHSGRVGSRAAQLNGRRSSPGTLQHFTCPLFHRWITWLFHPRFFVLFCSFPKANLKKQKLILGSVFILLMQETIGPSVYWILPTPRWWRCSSPTMTSPSWRLSGKSRTTSARFSPYRKDSRGWLINESIPHSTTRVNYSANNKWFPPMGAIACRTECRVQYYYGILQYEDISR